MRRPPTRLVRLEAAAHAATAEAASGRIMAMVRANVDSLAPGDPAALAFVRQVQARVRAGVAELDGQGAR
jgi:hypothetical protein